MWKWVYLIRYQEHEGKILNLKGVIFMWKWLIFLPIIPNLVLLRTWRKNIKYFERG